MLTAKQLRYFRERLETEKTEIEDHITTWKRDIEDPDYGGEAGVDDIGDESTRIFAKESELQNIRRAEERLREIEHALARIDEGVYGLSEVSGKPIPLERLEAMPSATTLVDEHLPT